MVNCVPFDDQFVLLLISSGNDEVILRGNKPVKLFEPIRLASLRHESGHSNFAQHLTINFNSQNIRHCTEKLNWFKNYVAVA